MCAERFIQQQHNEQRPAARGENARRAPERSTRISSELEFAASRAACAVNGAGAASVTEDEGSDRRTNPLVLPARLCGAAAGNRAHRYIGKVCCLLLVRADYIGRSPSRARGIARAVTTGAHWHVPGVRRGNCPSARIIAAFKRIPANLGRIDVKSICHDLCPDNHHAHFMIRVLCILWILQNDSFS